MAWGSSGVRFEQGSGGSGDVTPGVRLKVPEVAGWSGAGQVSGSSKVPEVVWCRPGVRFKAVRFKAVRFKAVRFKAVRFKAVRFKEVSGGSGVVLRFKKKSGGSGWCGDGVSAQIGSGVVQGGPEVRFHDSSTRFHEVLQGLRGGASTKTSTACCLFFETRVFRFLEALPSLSPHQHAGGNHLLTLHGLSPQRADRQIGK